MGQKQWPFWGEGQHQCSSPGSDLAGSDPTEERRPGHFGGTRGQPGTEKHSGGHVDDLCTETDIDGSYQHHANSYLTKPVDLEEFLNVVKSIHSFWLSVVNLPREARS
jgi:hypothetical protein